VIYNWKAKKDGMGISNLGDRKVFRHNETFQLWSGIYEKMKVIEGLRGIQKPFC